ncbi:hypothetical protein BD410DRAFT_796772 [Rickenella mellea]|uniref:Uncharacterized protein n=1 Tax=Rickenella mellea TaxID=50990 RepID=A0A4Y7PIH1_9AGAM|nr:hypothetical protein BD410DRAFT_796772 [Rickenella mellea]
MELPIVANGNGNGMLVTTAPRSADADVRVRAGAGESANAHHFSDPHSVDLDVNTKKLQARMQHEEHTRQQYNVKELDHSSLLRYIHRNNYQHSGRFVESAFWFDLWSSAVESTA